MTTPRHELITWHPASKPPDTERLCLVLGAEGDIALGTHRTYFGQPKWVSAQFINATHWAELPTGPSSEAEAIVAKAKMADELAEALAWLEVTAGCPSMEGDPNRVYVRKLLGRYKEAQP